MILGLTGGIASGKSTVGNMMKEYGIPVIDADEISRAVVAPGEETLEQIKTHFGQRVIHSDGTLNREELGTIVFSRPEERETLNELIHPAVRKRMQDMAEAKKQAGYQLIVLDIPLLVENNLFYLVDETVVVYASREIQKARLMARNGYNEEEAEQRLAAQMPIDEKRSFADHIIDNSGSLAETKNQVDQLIRACLD
ncbi:dephospho-CoA kinase [Salisediminibacterium halotolerans]|uniref:dephospho-CoA kinase n=1 Tax=Salisediminibacterium halotolerans TaxID=517425 RepID=UPI000EAC707F|nr:dephospho-CoA kinase [Salisediminibacterium halotolerans]RLJ80865.1 dephospho-CoA kinase [Actinophytocola xinjiangensis]RPE84036.1 dephospho-CoA kinase [Salisediminibacterium halotolerans]TWG37812.1 dephospho-CoA kinase [Salisediminibacterium halotolerans]GEL09086.1 dephospho-CoA kinase [Salisediminibacterium halotolerans]